LSHDENATIVLRRQRYIERQRHMHPETVDVRFRGAKPEGSGPPNRDGRPSVPVGQHLVKNWPVLDLGEQPEIPLETWRLDIAGLVDKPFTLDWQQLMLLPQVEDVSDFHCVTTWSRLDNHWKGIAFRLIAELAVPKEEARYVLCTVYDFLPGTSVPYTVNVPLARAIEQDVLLVHTWEGQPLPREHGGPLRMITPKLYAWKGAKWIRKIEFLAEDQKGFWEVRGYSNTAEPWFNDRYSD
jgi:DMSO/TMAO reductase YedYZ molybdopterin-dependent catalytic subunit